jgi:hypothetical protein
MKNIFALFLAALLLGFVIFAVSHWLFGSSVADSLDFSIPPVLAGVIVELLKPRLRNFMKKRAG